MEDISVFDIFKIGVGPSSSHTMGPWLAAQSFVNKINIQELLSVKVDLYGALSKTGKGHGTDIAVILGLSGYEAETIDTEKIDFYITEITTEKKININNSQLISFDPKLDINFNNEKLPYHPNAMTFEGVYVNGNKVNETYYSIGGGFIVQEKPFEEFKSKKPFPFPIVSEADILNYLENDNMTLYDIVYKNELAWRTDQEINEGIESLWKAMKTCVYRGCHKNGILPGGLNVTRRANNINSMLIGDQTYSNVDEWILKIKEGAPSFTNVTKWVTCFALAVNEENASFGRIVTAPTNGAAGVIPAVLLYLLCFCDSKEDAVKEFLFTAGEIGSLFKKGSTISAAMGGCQAEIGVSSAMAAAGLTHCLGGNSRQVLQSAEIAMEHHLGLTCDPIMGLVQVPCIERNAMGAMKAITATQIALASNPETAKVTLDQVIKTMKETALEMSEKFKETSEGGLAVNISVAVPEC